MTSIAHFKADDDQKADYKKTLSPAMNRWRHGFDRLPTAYIDYHEQLARETLGELATEQSLTVISTRMVRDGWMDGMKVLEAKITTSSGREVILRWSDSHWNGQWMVRCKSGGRGSLSTQDLI